MSKLLEVNNLATHFFTEEGVVKAVNGITYHLDEGEILGLVGESGCGKSVSALSIMRLVPDPPGRIVDGSVVYEMIASCDLKNRLVSEELFTDACDETKGWNDACDDGDDIILP